MEAAAESADLEYLLDEIPNAIAQSLEGVGRVAAIVRAMKEFSHPGTAHKTAVDLNRAIESTATVARNEWKYVADLVTDFDPDLPPVPCLPGELNQVFLNIIVNAAHAIGDVVGDGAGGKGTITITTRALPAGVPTHAEIRIADTGHGHPPGDSPQNLRPVLHHQGSRARHGAGTVHRARHRRREARRHHRLRERGGPGHDLHHPPAAWPGKGAARDPRAVRG